MPPPSRAISASEDASPAAPQSCSDSTRPRSTSSTRDLDQLLARERVADLDRRPLVRVVLAELLAREHARAADAVAAGRRAVEEDEVARFRSRLRLEHAVGGQEPDAHRVDEAVVRVGRVEDGLAADRGHADAVPVVRRSRRPRARTSSRGSPKRSPSSSAIGRAPIAMMSRRIPPTPVAAPWNGSTADGWLWLSTLNATASPSPRSTTPAFSPGPWSTRGARSGSASAGAPSACSRSAPTRGARRRRARSGSARARAAPGYGRVPRRSVRGRGGAAVRRPASESRV